MLIIEHMLLLKLDVNLEGPYPSSVELQDAAVDRMAMLSHFSKDNNGIFLKENLLFPLEEKNPYKSDVESLILDDTTPPKLSGKHAELRELQL